MSPRHLLWINYLSIINVLSINLNYYYAIHIRSTISTLPTCYRDAIDMLATCYQHGINLTIHLLRMCYQHAITALPMRYQYAIDMVLMGYQYVANMSTFPHHILSIRCWYTIIMLSMFSLCSYKMHPMRYWTTINMLFICYVPLHILLILYRYAIDIHKYVVKLMCRL